MKTIFKLAHRYTKMLRRRYPDVDYQVQFGLFVEYFVEITNQLNENIENKNIPAWFIFQENSSYVTRMMAEGTRELVKETKKAINVKFTIGKETFLKWIPKSILADRRLDDDVIRTFMIRDREIAKAAA